MTGNTKGGGPPKLSIKDKLTITLKYYRERRAMESAGAEYGVSKSAVCESIQCTLKRDKPFKAYPCGKSGVL
ncbi:MAG: transposase family protein [Treponema sp.]|jgi:hypothetical protein|nr:transposase family protein [Treponema sp.]